MLTLFSRRQPPLLGIDISSTAVKLLQLSKPDDCYRVEHYGIKALPVGAMNEKNIINEQAVGSTVKKLLDNCQTKLRKAAISVSGSAVITKVIEIDAGLNDHEMENQIKVEADQYIPYPLEEVHLDFEVMEPVAQRPDKVHVLLAACRSENVELRIGALGMAGITTEVVDIEAYAVERVVALLNRVNNVDSIDQRVAVIDIGATTTQLNVIQNGRSIYLTEQVFGGKQLSEEIQQHYGLSFAEAGLAKEQGGLPDDYEQQVLLPFKEAIVQQINRSLQFFFSSTHFDKVDNILLAGCTAIIPGLTALIEDKMGITTVVANPFANMSINPEINCPQILSDKAPSFVVACGLALRSFQ
jgi:type IV pilus assembly protein PilM